MIPFPVSELAVLLWALSPKAFCVNGFFCKTRRASSEPNQLLPSRDLPCLNNKTPPAIANGVHCFTLRGVTRSLRLPVLYQR
jgi:hypothetical protein